MSGTEWAVALAGAAVVAWINWYFFFAAGATGRAEAAGGVQEVTIRVQGGYEPAQVRVRAGTPVRLRFDRQERAGCSEEVVIPEFGVRRFLPPFETTTVELTPPREGSYEFTCGMGMLRGRLIVEEEG